MSAHQHGPGFAYVILFENNMLKIGQSKTPDIRVSSLKKDLKSKTSEIYISEICECALTVEKSVLASFSNIFEKPVKGRELFKGTLNRFTHAVFLIKKYRSEIGELYKEGDQLFKDVTIKMNFSDYDRVKAYADRLGVAVEILISMSAHNSNIHDLLSSTVKRLLDERQ